ncbi:MAG: ROK family protein [Oscillospiraceae bacterium]|nr:ROK family protein [Oscillospiraceae bacterium]
MPMNKCYKIGVDLGGMSIKAGVLDPDQKILVKDTCPTDIAGGPQKVLSDMAALVERVITAAGISKEECIGIGVGCPGSVDAQSGIFLYACNLGWEDVPLAQTLSELTGLPTRVSNDANCAVLGEVVAGAARGYEDVLLLTLGTGVGGGLVWGGKIFEGGKGGMELGHVMLRAGGLPCSCGRNGCLEVYTSATALMREAKNACETHPESMMNQMMQQKGAMDGIIPFEAMRAGDETACKVIEHYIADLGDGITDLVNTFRPQLVLLSGGISNQGNYLTDPLNDYLAAHAYAGEHLPIPRVCRAELGNDAGLVGAANLF